MDLTPQTEDTIGKLAHAFDGYKYARVRMPSSGDPDGTEALKVLMGQAVQRYQIPTRTGQAFALNFYLHRNFHHWGNYPAPASPYWYLMVFLFLHLYRSEIRGPYRSQAYIDWSGRRKGSGESAATELRKVLSGDEAVVGGRDRQNGSPDPSSLEPSKAILHGGCLPLASIYDCQADFMAQCTKELIVAYRAAFRTPFSDSDFRQAWRLMKLPEYRRWTHAALACGFVCGDFEPTEDIESVMRRPELVEAMNFSELRRFVHTLQRYDKWNDGNASAVGVALAAGTLDVVARRLADDESLYRVAL